MNIKKRRKRITLYLYNDEFNSFDYVTQVLSKYIPNCNIIRAEQLAVLAHNKGCIKICTGFSPEIYQIQANLIRHHLLVETENYL
tara:strand:- start:526 stop:780 length:255 start_codon:yes stop_codon:yes gene_type:complete